MENLSATDAARNFAEVLDAVESRGTTYVIYRHGRPVARLGPAPVSNGATVKRLLRRHRPDKGWLKELQELRASLQVQERDWPD
jgi:prevent-host-death family protein